MKKDRFDEPAPYGLTEAGKAALIEHDRRRRQGKEAPGAEAAKAAPAAPAALGRSPAVLPSQKQASASKPSAPVIAEITAPAESKTCAECRLLLGALSDAVHEFTQQNGPFVRNYAKLSYSQVATAKKCLEALGKRVQTARAAYQRHSEKHEARR